MPAKNGGPPALAVHAEDPSIIADLGHAAARGPGRIYGLNLADGGRMADSAPVDGWRGIDLIAQVVAEANLCPNFKRQYLQSHYRDGDC